MKISSFFSFIFCAILFYSCKAQKGGKINACEHFENNIKSSISSFLKGDPEYLYSILDTESLSIIPSYIKNNINEISLKKGDANILSVELISTSNNIATYKVKSEYFSIHLEVSYFEDKCYLNLEEKDLIAILTEEIELKARIVESLINENEYKKASRWIVGGDYTNGLTKKTNVSAFRKRKEFNQYFIKQGKRSELIQLYKIQALDGDTSAMIELGNFYDGSQEILGYVLPDDYTPEASISWYEMAAKKGSVFAMLKTANAYEKGNGINKDNDKAIFWYKKVYLEKPNLVILKLAELISNQNASEEYRNKAFELAKSNGKLAYEIAQGYEKGRHGFKIDTSQAIQWYEIAKDLGDSFAAYNLRRLKKE